MAGLSISYDEWPIVTFRADNTPVTDEQFEAILVGWAHEIRRRSGPFGGLHDLRMGTMGGALTPRQRKQLTESMARNEELAHRCVGHAMIIDGVVMRHLLTAVLWMRPRSYPVRVFATFDEGRAWLSAQLGLASSTRITGV